MATLKNRLLQSEWWFFEHGGTSLFNELMRFAEATPGGNITISASRTFGAIDLAAPTSSGAASAPIPPGINQSGWGFGQQQVAGTNPRPPVLDQP